MIWLQREILNIQLGKDDRSRAWIIWHARVKRLEVFYRQVKKLSKMSNHDDHQLTRMQSMLAGYEWLYINSWSCLQVWVTAFVFSDFLQVISVIFLYRPNKNKELHNSWGNYCMLTWLVKGHILKSSGVLAQLSVKKLLVLALTLTLTDLSQA